MSKGFNLLTIFICLSVSSQTIADSRATDISKLELGSVSDGGFVYIWNNPEIGVQVWFRSDDLIAKASRDNNEKLSWLRQMTSTANGTTNYVPDGMIYMHDAGAWVMHNYLRASQGIGKDTRSAILHYVAHCDHESISIDSVIEYSGYFQAGQVIRHFDPSGDESRVVPNTAGEAIFKNACANSP